MNNYRHLSSLRHFESVIGCGILVILLFDHVFRKWLAVVKPLSAPIFFLMNSKLVGGLQTKEGAYGLQEKVCLLIFIFIFFSR